LFFFFSSRRRHTRFKCDWSSDVCSSDLAPYGAHGNPGFGIPYFGLCRKIEDQYGHLVEIEYCPVTSAGKQGPAPTPSDCVPCKRSEERRVGKGDRRQRWTDTEQHKSRRS